MSLEEVHKLAYEYLASKPDYASFMPTVSGKSQPVIGNPELGAKKAGEAITPIENIRDGVSNNTKALVDVLLDNHTHLNWWNAYKEGDPAGRGMVERTAGCLLTGEAAPFSAEAGCAGFFYLQADVEYAAHAHMPDEIYAILSGRARFWDSEIGWREAGAGDIVHMPSMIWHGMETREEPVLILWAWKGDNLGEKPVFRDNYGELPK